MPFYPYAVLQNYGFGNKYHNLFRSIHAASTMPKYSNFRKDYNRLALYRRPIPGGVSGANALAIRSLERKVAGLKPETQYHFISDNFSALAGDTLHVLNWSPTEDLAAAADRDERILGDSWKNKFMEIRAQFGGILGFPGPLRLIVYKPHKAGTTLTFSNFNNMMDPSQSTVLHDEIIKPYAVHDNSTTTGGSQALQVWARKINLSNTKSTFIGTTAEAGNIRCVILLNGMGSATPTLGGSVTTKLAYSNK